MTQLKSIEQIFNELDNSNEIKAIGLYVLSYNLAEKYDRSAIKKVSVDELVSNYEVRFDEPLESLGHNYEYYATQPIDSPAVDFNAFMTTYLKDKNIPYMLHFETSTDVVDLYVIIE